MSLSCKLSLKFPFRSTLAVLLIVFHSWLTPVVPYSYFPGTGSDMKKASFPSPEIATARAMELLVKHGVHPDLVKTRQPFISSFHPLSTGGLGHDEETAEPASYMFIPTERYKDVSLETYLQDNAMGLSLAAKKAIFFR